MGTHDLFELDWPDVEEDKLEQAVSLWRYESEIMAFATMMLWCRMLHCLLPYKYVDAPPNACA